MKIRHALALMALTAPAALAEPLTLERAVSLALARNERAAAAEMRVEASEARVSRARAFFFPDVVVNANYTRNRYENVRRIGDEDVVIQSQNAFGATTNLSATLFNARAFPLYRQARLEHESTELDSAEDQRLLAFEAADAFIITLSLEQVLKAAEERRDLARETLDDAGARLEAGLVSSNDVTKAELEYATSEREVSRAHGDVRTSYIQLGNLLNAPVEGPLIVPEQFLQSANDPPPVDDAAVSQAEERRQDILASERHVAALEQFAREPSQRFIPSLVLNGQHRYNNVQGLSSRQNDGFLGLVLTWNAFDGGEWRAERAERRALVREAQLNLELDRRGVGMQMRTALAELESEQASIRQAIAAVDAARRNAAETTQLYRNGLAGALEVADATASLFDAEVQAARARYQLALAYLDLRAAMGLDPVEGVRNE